MVQSQMSLGRRQPIQLRDRKGETMCVEERNQRTIHIAKHDALHTVEERSRMIEIVHQASGERDRSSFEKHKCQEKSRIRFTTEMLHWGAANLIPLITELFNECLRTGSVPEGMADSITILLHKNGTYKKMPRPQSSTLITTRPISLLPVLYKLLTKIANNLANRPVFENVSPRQTILTLSMRLCRRATPISLGRSYICHLLDILEQGFSIQLK
ncbi:hypothetical protein COOONC_24962 [Cooperia oncophora]